MPRVCYFTGRKTHAGGSTTRRGKAKYLGGVGTKITGITRRQFKPNLQRVRVTTKSGANKRMRVCAQCIRSGRVTKAIKQRPFRLPQGAGDAAASK